MVKLESPAQYNHVTHTALVSLSADSKSEVNENMTVVGLIEGYTLESGSTVFTASKELGTLKENGSWQW